MESEEEEMTQGDMLQAMREALALPELYTGEAYTKKELATRWKLSETTARRKVEAAVENGVYDEVWVTRIIGDGPRRIRAYRMKDD